MAPANARADAPERVTSAHGRDLSIPVRGLVCATCAEQMVRRLEHIPAVERASFDLVHHSLQVHLRVGRKLSDQRIADIVGDEGYPVGTVNRVLAAQPGMAPVLSHL